MNSEPEQEVIDALPVPVVEALNRAEIDVQIRTAKQYPRSIRRFKDEATAMATLDEETATGCFYALRRDKKVIEGPSIRLAEIVMSSWGNLRAGTRVIDIDDKFVTAQAVCHDLETNVAISVECKRRITTKEGRRYGDDMIGVTANAALAIAIRNSVFKVVPMVYTRAIMRAARKVAVGDAKTLSARRHEMVDYFGKMGVALEHVLYVLDKQSIDDIGLDDLALLKGLATAIKDGDTTIEQAFPEPVDSESANDGGRTAAVGAKVKGQVAKLKAHAAEPADPAPPAETSAPPDLTQLRGDVLKRLTALPPKIRDAVLAESGLTEAYLNAGTLPETLKVITDADDLNDILLRCADAAGKAKGCKNAKPSGE